MDGGVEGGDADDVYVETVEDAKITAPDAAAGGPTANSNPDWLVDGVFGFFDVVQSNGWIFLIVLVGLWFLKRKLEEHLREKRSRDDDAMHARDPDQLLDLQLRREERIRRLQEQQDAAAARAAEKQREKEEKERKERIEDYDAFLAGKGYKAKSTRDQNGGVESVDEPPSPPGLLSSNRPRQRLRDDDFNPMMGSGGSGGYRPAPRGGGSGGG